MVALKVKSGSNLHDTLVIGKITAKMVLASSSTRMVISMKACGVLTVAMARVLIGAMKLENSGENIRVIGSRIRNMAEVLSFIRMGTDMMGIGSMACLKEKAE